MPAVEWYRRKNWTASDRAEFFERLRRSRGAFHKAQYARIQAYELQVVGTEDAVRGAMELLDMILAEWRSEAQLSQVYQQRAECFVRLGQQDRAIESFREVFRTQREQRGMITDAHLDFGWLCISTPLPNLYAEVLSVLDEFQYEPVFPAHVYRDAVVRAVILDSQGQHDLARDYAQSALSTAALTRTSLPRHPTLGLVKEKNSDIHARVEAIAGNLR